MDKNHPKSLLEAVRYFSDLDVCHEYIKGILWPDGVVTCPKCGSDHVGEIKTRRMFQCKSKDCRKQFSCKVGTIFEDSPLGFDKWFVAVWCIVNAKNGISSCELARALGVTQKSAWFMLHRIRLAMKTKSFKKIKGEIESDESYVGGRLHNMHREKRKKARRKWNGKGVVNKAIVQGLLERGGDVRARVIKNNRAKTLRRIIDENVEKGASIYTDYLRSYRTLRDEYIHKMIDHSVAYVRGRVHTNGLENFWALLKRALSGTYVAVAPEHLNAYLDEQCRRFNDRKMTDGDRFAKVMRMVQGRRLTYEALKGRTMRQGECG